jgi:hypothetical protein
MIKNEQNDGLDKTNSRVSISFETPVTGLRPGETRATKTTSSRFFLETVLTFIKCPSMVMGNNNTVATKTFSDIKNFTYPYLHPIVGKLKIDIAREIRYETWMVLSLFTLFVILDL